MEDNTPVRSLTQRATALYRFALGSALRFGVVGLACYIIDVGIFNLIRLGVFGHEGFFTSPIGAKMISVSIAMVASWLGNRLWAFRKDRRQNAVRELGEFVVVALGGMGIGLLCLWVSHYLLGFTSLLADNISANVVGLVLGTTFRFMLYRFWVYSPSRRGRVAQTRPEVNAVAARLRAATLEP